MMYEKVAAFLLSLRDFNSISVTVRLVLALVCGGLIGVERMYKHRPAGMRTHMLVCLGAAMTTLTGQYLFFRLHQNTDMLRLGAQVISGIGFIGAGTILVTKNRRVRGLTTAAGLWTAAIIGLACGAGYYEGAMIATAMVLLAELFFSKLEYYVGTKYSEAHMFLQYEKTENLEAVIQWLQDEDIKLTNLQMTRIDPEKDKSVCAVCTLRLNRKWTKYTLREQLSSMDGILALEEM